MTASGEGLRADEDHPAVAEQVVEGAHARAGADGRVGDHEVEGVDAELGEEPLRRVVVLKA